MSTAEMALASFLIPVFAGVLLCIVYSVVAKVDDRRHRRDMQARIDAVWDSHQRWLRDIGEIK